MDNTKFTSTLASRLDMTPGEVDGMLDAIHKALVGFSSDLDSVAIPGFGTFRPEKKEEQIITDENGERKLCPPAIELTFHPSIILRKKLSR